MLPLRAVASTLGVALVVGATASAARVTLPDPAADDPTTGPKTTATLVLAGGCFWGMEEVFQHVRGVVDVTSGYAGGAERDANYEYVSTGRTNNAEAVAIRYDATRISMGR